MTIGEFLEKYYNKYCEKIKSIKRKDEERQEEERANVEKINNIRTKQYNFRIISERLMVVGIIAATIFAIVGYIMFIPPFYVLVPISVIGGGAYLGYRHFENKLTQEYEEALKKLHSDSSNQAYLEFQEEKRFVNIRNKIDAVEKYFEKSDELSYLERKIPVTEDELLFCLKNDLSLIPTFYLANQGLLPAKKISELTSKELLQFKEKITKLNVLLNNNPSIFFGKKVDWEQIEAEKEAKKTAELEAKKKVMNASRYIPPVRHPRGAKYGNNRRGKNYEQTVVNPKPSYQIVDPAAGCDVSVDGLSGEYVDKSIKGRSGRRY